MALLDLIQNTMTALDDNQSTIGVYIDLKEAFATIDHLITPRKLDHCGIRDAVHIHN